MSVILPGIPLGYLLAHAAQLPRMQPFVLKQSAQLQLAMHADTTRAD